MNSFLLYIFVAISLAMTAPALWRKDYRLQFPCLAGLTVLFQIALPMAALITQPDEVSSDAISRFGVMAILCLVAAWAGYVWWKPVKGLALPRFDDKKLATAAIFLVFFGAFFVWKTRTTIPDIDEATTNWTGPIVIYSTLSLVMRYGAMLAAILFFRTRKWGYLLLALPQLWQYANLFLVGRRSSTGEVLVVICLLMFFYRKWALPLWLMLPGVFAMALFCFNIGTIRATNDLSLNERIQAIKAADPLHSITTEGMAEDRKFVEIYNGANLIDAAAKNGYYNYGAKFWNFVVFGYVPAQIVGRGVKDGLMIPLRDDGAGSGFERSNGTCLTGIGEVFMAFGYFGCGMYFALGAFMRWAWEGAIRNSVFHLLLLMLFSLPSVMSFSNNISAVILMAVNVGIFLLPFLWWSALKTQGRVRVRPSIK